MSIVALLLAAGSGKRFDASGTHLKLLEPAPCGPHAGTAIAVAAARSLRAVFGEVFAVVRPAARAPQQQLHGLLASEGCRLLVCPNADEGMGTSLAFGVRATADASGWIVALADMPAIRAATIRAVRDALAAGAICAAVRYAGRRSHPVGFSRTCYVELSELCGDEGARGVLQRHAPVLIDVDDPGCVFDVDRPEELRR